MYYYYYMRDECYSHFTILLLLVRSIWISNLSFFLFFISFNSIQFKNFNSVFRVHRRQYTQAVRDLKMQVHIPNRCALFNSMEATFLSSMHTADFFFFFLSRSHLHTDTIYRSINSNYLQSTICACGAHLRRLKKKYEEL